MEGELITTASESKHDIKSENPKAGLYLVSMETEPSTACNLDTGKLLVIKDDTPTVPYEGMEFESEAAAKEFYSAYARHMGFSIRISRYTCSRRDNSIISRRIVCSKEGFREVRANEGSLSQRRQTQRAVTRVGCKAMIMVKKLGSGKWVVTKLVREHNHGLSPPRKLEVRSAHPKCDLIEQPRSFDGDTIQEPSEGMEFESEEDAKLFYINYATQKGFHARISRYCRSRRDNSIISRHIVCSKEGFREVRLKEIPEEGKTKRPRMITRVGCKAMMVVKKVNTGKWIVMKFEKEHNHGLLSSRKESCLPSNIDLIDLPLGKSVVSNGLKFEGYSAGTRESRTVLYNQLCCEAIKFAQEGSTTEEIYNVAMSALKEAVMKVSAAKRGMKFSQCGLPHEANKQAFVVSQGSDSSSVMLEKALPDFQFLDKVKQTMIAQPLKLLQNPVSLVLVPSNVYVDSASLKNSVESSGLPISANGGKDGDGEGSNSHAENTKEMQMVDADVQFNIKIANSQTVRDLQTSTIQTSDRSIPGDSGSSMVAISALPVALHMPVLGSLPAFSVPTPGAPDSSYTPVAAPMQAQPISSRPAETVSYSKNALRCCSSPLTSPLATPSVQCKHRAGPDPLVHATAIACGARVVPPKEAASLIKAIEAKVRRGGAMISAAPHAKKGGPLAAESPSTSSSDVEEGQREAAALSPAPDWQDPSLEVGFDGEAFAEMDIVAGDSQDDSQDERTRENWCC